MTTPEMEIALSHYFNPRRNLIVPNISWGMFTHECDLLVLTKAGYAYEIEIKISKADLLKDREKRHNHESKKISRLFFALPEPLIKWAEYVPARAGIISVTPSVHTFRNQCRIVREAAKTNTYKFAERERYDVARLATLRIWGLKQTIERLKKERRKQI